MRRLMMTTLVAMALTGFCREETRPVAGTNEVAFVVVDGWPLTVSAVSNIVMVQARMREVSHRPVEASAFPFWANHTAYGVMQGMLFTRLLEQDVRRQGLSRTPSSDAAVLARYNRSMRQKAKSENELGKKFGPLEKTFHEMFDRDSLLEAYYSSNPECAVSEADLRRRYAFLSNRVHRAERINKEAQEKAQKAYARLQAGERWEVVATNVTEDALIEESYKDNWRDWGMFKLSAVEPEALAKALMGMKVGDYTKPIESDEGLIIVKLTEKDDVQYSLARILFRMGAVVEIPDRKELTKQMEEKKRERLQRKVLPPLREKAKIEFPFGTNFVYKIWKEPDQPKKKGRMPFPGKMKLK